MSDQEKNELFDEMLKDVEEQSKPSLQALNDAKMNELARLVQEQMNIEKTIAEYEECLEKLKEDLRQVSEIKIPDIFDELGFDKIKLKSGEKIEIKRGYAATISEENRAAAFDWLKENNHDDIIKHDVIVKLKKGESEDHTKITEFLEKEGVPYEDKEHIHPATLKAFVNEQMEAGSDIPQDVFKVFPIRKTKIKG